MSLSHVFGVKNKKGYSVLFGVTGALFVVLPLVLPIKNIVANFFCLGAGKYVTVFVQYAIPF